MRGVTDKIRALLNSRPFRPFTIFTSDGQKTTVNDPEFAWVHPFGRTMYVCPDPNRDVDQVIDLLHVTKLAYPLPNGRGRKRGKQK